MNAVRRNIQAHSREGAPGKMINFLSQMLEKLFHISDTWGHALTFPRELPPPNNFAVGCYNYIVITIHLLIYFLLKCTKYVLLNLLSSVICCCILVLSRCIFFPLVFVTQIDYKSTKLSLFQLNRLCCLILLAFMVITTPKIYLLLY